MDSFSNRHESLISNRRAFKCNNTKTGYLLVTWGTFLQVAGCILVAAHPRYGELCPWRN